MFHPDYLGGGFSATFVDVTITGDLDFGSASVQSLFLGDNDELRFGNTAAASNAQLTWETADANANCLLLSLPTGGGTDVPVLAITDASGYQQDLGLFDGITDPTIGLLNAAGSVAGTYSWQQINMEGLVNETAYNFSIIQNATGSAVSGKRWINIEALGGTGYTGTNRMIYLRTQDSNVAFLEGNSGSGTTVLLERDGTLNLAGELNFFGEGVLTSATAEDFTIRPGTGGKFIMDASVVISPTAVQTLGAADQISPTTSSVDVQSDGGAVTLTSTPHIDSTGVNNGERLRIWGRSDTDLLTLQDNSNLAGSDLKMNGSTNFTLGLGDNIEFEYRLADGVWYEISRSDN